jgi:hypothetical protein
MVNNNGVINRGYSWSFASFGYERKVSGDTYISALWVPIKIHKEPSPKASFKYSPKIMREAGQIVSRKIKKQRAEQPLSPFE